MNKYISEVTNEDCMIGMARYPDKYFDLAIVDPPYGMDKNTYGSGKLAPAKFRCDKINHREWDIKPSIEYTKELQRVSKNQIVWGANHFISRMPYDSSCWIVWDKNNGDSTFADCELAWGSFGTTVRKYTKHATSAAKNKIHPTQKPKQLYKWILSKFATEGQTILDTHLGSGNSAVAAWEEKFSFVGIEINETYYNNAVKHFQEQSAQLRLF